MIKCRLAKGYGWTNEEIEKLNLDQIGFYLKGLERLNNEDRLNWLPIVDYGNWTGESRKKYYQELLDKVFPRNEKPKQKVLTTDELIPFLKVKNG